MTWLRRHRAASPPSIAPEVEAYLEGGYVAYVSRLGWSVPPWAWLNRCAHGDRRALRALASAGVDELWGKAEQVLAGELLAIVGDDEGLLLGVQCQVLIPLELALIDGASDRLTAQGLVLSVRAALRSSLS
jgi:hypothetical protein